MVEQHTTKNSELMFTKGVAYDVLNEKEKAEYYYRQALYNYPASVYYALRLTRYYIDQNNLRGAKEVIDSINRYREKYTLFKNPNGVYFYVITDFEAELAYKEGNLKKALSIAQQNLHNAEADLFITSSIKAREFITRENVIQYLKARMEFYEKSQ